MTTITLGENGSLMLPEALRNGLRLQRGAKLEAALIGDHIELKPCSQSAPPSWLPGFFDRLAIDDPAFERPSQGTMPAAVELRCVKFLLDTNTCIALMRRNARVRQRMERLAPGDCAVSEITALELYHGLERCAQPEREQAKIGELLSVVEVLPF